MLRYDDLTTFDFQILNAVYENQPVTMVELADIFPNQQALRFRVEKLTTSDKIQLRFGMSLSKGNTSLLKYNVSRSGGKTLCVTDLGIKILEDWKFQCLKENHELWENRFWKIAPIIISSIALIKSFWPEIKAIWQMLQQAQ